ncbi:MAG: Ppx/GppA family phosphatase [Actinobacteria bacterium]|nr:Ppx/GppA family phosphatase [Actinomycetota bacterium]
MSRRLGAVDIGTNSVRLLVADVDGSDADMRVATLERLMTITRLGQGVDEERRLHPEAIARTLAVLDRYGAIARDLGVEALRATATSAARDAANRDDLFDPAEAALGVRPELLSGAEEARLSFLGATASLADVGATPPYLVVDIGGGSTEFVLGTDAPSGLLSVDMGCVRITEQYLHSDPPAPEELSTAVSIVRDHLTDVERAIPDLRDARTLVGLAGTVSAVATVEQGLHEYDRDRIHHFRLTRAAVEDVFRTLATEAADDRRHNPGLEAERVDVIVGGVTVLATVMRTFGFDELLVSEEDILDGLVRDLAAR